MTQQTDPERWTALYPANIQRNPLTDEEVIELMPYCHNEFDIEEYRKFARDIEKAHGIKEKNTI